MKIQSWLAVGILAFGVGFSPVRGSDTEDLMRLEQVWNEAHMKGNAATLDRLWSDEMEVVVPKMPAMEKGDVLAFARSGKMKFESYSTSDVQARVYGDTALVTGRLKRSRIMNGQTINDDWLFTKVYRRDHGQWRVIHFQASDAPTEKNG